MDEATQYDDNDVRALLNAIINTQSGDGNALRTSLDGLTSRVTTVETIANHDCGGTCPAGQRVSTECDPTNAVKTQCSACDNGKYSFGGLVPSCLDCDTCAANFYEVTGCTTSSNRLCAKCDRWYAFELWLSCSESAHL